MLHGTQFQPANQTKSDLWTAENQQVVILLEGLYKVVVATKSCLCCFLMLSVHTGLEY